MSKVLEGSVRKAGNRIGVTVQLINVPDGCHLWSERYQGELTDIFAIHEKISSAIRRALQVQMLGSKSPSATRAEPQSLESYNHYLQGRFLWKKRTEQGLTHIRDVVAILDREDLHDVVLVGHSYAGMIITGVAEHA